MQTNACLAYVVSHILTPEWKVVNPKPHRTYSKTASTQWEWGMSIAKRRCQDEHVHVLDPGASQEDWAHRCLTSSRSSCRQQLKMKHASLSVGTANLTARSCDCSAFAASHCRASGSWEFVVVRQSLRAVKAHFRMS